MDLFLKGSEAIRGHTDRSSHSFCINLHLLMEMDGYGGVGGGGGGARNRKNDL